jgi:hypothetical protein
VYSSGCVFRTSGPAYVDSGMTDVVQRCLLAFLESSALDDDTRADLTSARTGMGAPRQIGNETLTVPDDASIYGVTATAS